MSTAPKPREADQNKPIDVALALVVDKLSDQFTRDPPNNCPKSRDEHAHHLVQLLIAQRKADQVLGGYWELPGGKVEPNEPPRDAAERELREEVGIAATLIHTLPTVTHHYDHAHVRLHPFIFQITAGTPSAIQSDAVRWVHPNELTDYRFPPATLPILAEFLNWLSMPDNTLANTHKHKRHRA